MGRSADGLRAAAPPTDRMLSSSPARTGSMVGSPEEEPIVRGLSSSSLGPACGGCLISWTTCIGFGIGLESLGTARTVLAGGGGGGPLATSKLNQDQEKVRRGRLIAPGAFLMLEAVDSLTL